MAFVHKDFTHSFDSDRERDDLRVRDVGVIGEMEIFSQRGKWSWSQNKKKRPKFSDNKVIKTTISELVGGNDELVIK
jgi:hypothetical protein